MGCMRKVTSILVWVISSVFFILASIVSIHKHWQFGSGYYDFGIFDTALWKISQGQLPIIDHYILSGKVHMADHFTPSLYLFAPLYWISQSQLTMFVAQAAVVAISGVLIFYTMKKVVESDIVAFALYISYIGFVGLHNALYFDIHAVTFMTLFLALAYWALVSDRKKIFVVAFILILGFKESLFLLGAGLAVLTYMYKREWRKLAIWMFIGSLAWGFIATKFVIPFFSGGRYIYSFTPEGSLTQVLPQLFSPIDKVYTLFWSLINFALLPLAGLEAFVIMGLHYVSRFLTPGAERWGLGLHYNAEIAPTLVFAAGLGFNRMKRYVRTYSKHFVYASALCLVIGTAYISLIVQRTPLYLALIPDFYTASQGFDFLNEMVDHVPSDASVMAQNNLLAHFTHQDAWLIRENYEDYGPDYILFDMRGGQSPAQVLEYKQGEIAATLKKVSVDPNYELYWSSGEQSIYRNIAHKKPF